MKKKLLLMMTLAICWGLAGCAQQTEKTPTSSTEKQKQNEETIEQVQDENSFQNLNLNIKKGTLRIRTGEAFSCTYHGAHHSDYQISDKTLSIDQNIEGEIILTLPNNTEYNALTLTVGNGHVYLENDLSLQSLNLNVSQGEVNLSYLSVTDNTTIDVERGSAYFSGDLGKTVNVQDNEGKLSMVLSVPQNIYNYQIEGSNGSLLLGDQSYKNRSFLDNIDNNASQTMTLKCTKGNISVKFNN